METSLSEFLDDHSAATPFGAAFADATLQNSSVNDTFHRVLSAKLQTVTQPNPNVTKAETFQHQEQQESSKTARRLSDNDSSKTTFTSSDHEAVTLLTTASKQTTLGADSFPSQPRRLLSTRQHIPLKTRVLPGMPCYEPKQSRQSRPQGSTASLPLLPINKPLATQMDRLAKEYYRDANLARKRAKNSEQAEQAAASLAMRYCTMLLRQQTQSGNDVSLLEAALTGTQQLLASIANSNQRLADKQQELKDLKTCVENLQQEFDQTAAATQDIARQVMEAKQACNKEEKALADVEAELEQARQRTQSLRVLDPLKGDVFGKETSVVRKHRLLVERVQQQKVAQAADKIQRKYCAPASVYINLQQCLEEEHEKAQMAAKEIELLQIELSQAQSKERQTMRIAKAKPAAASQGL
eukprot:TRINITY_DN11222_c0_g1_i10.p1 TRINITY_DN11222_c0_g1~~TRINITY_DN11222_c0_g1_i10.p1  ORF type:complete len:454 (+),score=91.18 TRINITY_DN11222_c0_g1_i10:128-1363(+)